MSRQLTQQEIDSFFQSAEQRAAANAKRAVQYDFRRPDRISKAQVRAIHMMHDNFVRNLVSSLSAYLRAYLTINLISVEQLAYSEFLEGLPTPTCLVALSMRPYDGNAVLEMSPTLAFPVLEMLLGGQGSGSAPKREITEIERNLLQAFFKVVLHDLRTAWRTVEEIDFGIESMETEPQFLRILAPNEAVVAIAIEMRIGENIGMLDIAIPCIVIKMMRQKFDQQWTIRRTESSSERQLQIINLINSSTMEVETILRGPTLPASELAELKVGDLLVFDHPVGRPLELTVNGVVKFAGQAVAFNGRKKGFEISDAVITSASPRDDSLRME